MNTGNIIALLSLVLAGIVLLVNSRKDTRGDAARDARMEAKVDSIASGVTDMRVELRTMQNKLEDQGQRLAAVESSGKSAHHRIDELEKKFNAAHPVRPD